MNIREVSKRRYSLYSALRSSSDCFALALAVRFRGLAALGLPFRTLALGPALEQLAPLSSTARVVSILKICSNLSALLSHVTIATRIIKMVFLKWFELWIGL